MKNIEDFIGSKAKYDPDSGYLFGTNDDGIITNLLLEIRGWGSMQKMFKKDDLSFDFESAMKFQDDFGKWISDAINEKLERDKTINDKNI